MDNTTKAVILFIAPTGGCALTALAHTLNAGYPCIALVRTPLKLTELLKGAGVDNNVIESCLTIHCGNALDVLAIKKALVIQSGEDVQLPNTIISGLGGAPKFRFNLPPLDIDQPAICRTGAAVLVTALSDIYSTYPELRASMPLLCFISTGGCSPGEDDVAWAIRLLYHTLLYIPFKDKKEMDTIFFGEESSRLFKAVIAVKPTLLTDGPELGSEKLKVGRRQEGVSGYTVSRKDVGAWIYRSVVLGEGKGLEGEMVTLTY